MKTLWKMWIGATAVLVTTTGATLAQTPTMSLPSGAREQPLSPEERERRRAVDDAYKGAMKKIPDKPTTVDPWATVRPQPSPTTSSAKPTR